MINWNANDPGAASTWYIVKVEDINIPLNDGHDGKYYATLCLPFDVTLSSDCAYTLTVNNAKNGLTLSEAISEVPAGTPVLLRHTESSVTASIASSAAYASAPLTTTALTGVYTNTAVTGGTDYFLGIVDSKMGFYHWLGSTLKANRAYLEASKLSQAGAGVKGFALNFDLPTIIDALNAQEASKGAIYNLAGQRVNRAQKGIFIMNGKKVVK